MKENLIIELGSSSIFAHTADGSFEKKIAIDDFVRGLIGSSATITTPILPSNCIYYRQEEGTLTLLLVFNPTKQKATFVGNPLHFTSTDCFNKFCQDYILTGKVDADYNIHDDSDDYDSDDSDGYDDYDLNDEPEPLRYTASVPSEPAGQEKTLNVDIKEMRFRVPTPIILYACRLRIKDGSFLIYRDAMYALKKYPEDLNDYVYRLPFPNVYERGKVCWGEIFRLGMFSNLTVLNEMVNIFFTTKFNNDIREFNFEPSALGLNFSDYLGFSEGSNVSSLCYLDGLEEFPVKALVADGKTIQDVLHYIRDSNF